MQQAAPEAPSSALSDDAMIPRDALRAVREDGSVDPGFRGSLDVAVKLFEHMVTLRVLSARMVDLQRTEKVALHSSSLGEEGVIAAAALAAREQDWVFPGAREWGAAIVRGLGLSAYAHHAFGTSLDPAKGHSAPDHPPARAVKVAPASGVVGAHVPQAVGAAWAAKIKKEDVATVALFGEGATSTGDFHNALNFAGVFKAPTVFVCRNNGRAVSTPVSRQTKSESFAAKAVAYGVASATVDGSDALAVFTLVHAAIQRAAEGKGPTLIEAITTPLGDTGGDVLGDVAGARGGRDPIARLRGVLERERLVDRAALETIVRDARAAVDAAVNDAERAALPPPSTIFDDVFAEVPAHLALQKESATWRR